MNNLKNRGAEDILIAVVPSHRMQAFDCRVTDGLKGFPDAINAAFPDTTVQTCIVHPLADSALPPAMSRQARAPFSELLWLERSQGCGQIPEADLSSR